jgi:hypothetical protein
MVQSYYFNTEIEIDEWVKNNQKKLKRMSGIGQDRESGILYPDEIEEYFGKHKERYVLRLRKHIK